VNILYVEDNQVDAQLLIRSLERSAPEINVQWVSTLAEACGGLEQSSPDHPRYDIVLTDMGLPDGNGLSILPFLQKRKIPLPVVVITGMGTEEIVVAALKAGAVDYLVKGSNYLENLPHILRQALDRYKADMTRSSRHLSVLYVENCAEDAGLTLRHFADLAPYIHMDVVSASDGMFRQLGPSDKNGSPGNQYDLLLLAYHSQEENRFSLLRQLREVYHNDLPVIIVTSQGSEEIALQALRFGATDYVAKTPGYLFRLPLILENAYNRTQAELEHASLRASEKYFRLLIGGISDVILELDADHNIRYAGPSVETVLGYMPEELIGESCFDITHPDDAALVGEALACLTNSPDLENSYIETRVLHKDRSWHIMEWAGKNATGSTGQFITVINARDVTKRKAAEKKLIESEERYRAAIEGSNDGVVLIRKGEVLYANRKLLEMFGYANPDDLVGQSALSVVHPDDKEMIKDYNRRRELGGPAPTQYEFKGIRKDGQTVFIEMSLSRIAYRGESATLAFLRDITRRKKAEEGWKLDETRLESLLKISQYTAESNEELLDFALEQAIALTRSKIGYIYFYDEETQEFTLSTWSRNVMNECAIANPERLYHLEKTGVWGEAVRQRRPVILNNYKAPDPLKKGYPQSHADLSRFLTIPVIILDRLVAVIGVANKAVDYDDSDVRQLTLLMDSVWQFMERKKSEEIARKAGEEWRATFDAIEDPIMLLGLDHKIIRANEATAAFLNLPVTNISGHHCHSLMHGRTGKPAACPLSRMAETKRHEEMELYVEEKRMWFSVSVDPVLDSNGEISGVVHVAKDITERKISEATIRRSEEKYRNIFENALEGIFQVTEEGSFISVNPAFAHMHGFDSPEDLIQSVQNTLQLYCNREDRSRYTESMTQKGVVEKLESQMLKKDGTVIWVSASARLIKDAAGTPLYYEGTVEDITTRKNAEMSLLKTLAELESKNRELADTHAAFKESQKKIFQQEKMASIGQLAAGVAHEINNPTGFIISNLNSQQKYMRRIREFITFQSETVGGLLAVNMDERESILKRLADKRKELKVDFLLEDSENIIGESLDGADRIKRIVQDLKSFSRTEDTGYTAADINKSLESTLNIVWNELKYKATVKKEYGEVPLIRCNPGQLSQVFMNILVNASHAIPESGEITISTWHDGPNVYVAISDTGTGIPEDQLGRIFEPFFTTKEIGKGTGLGLSIVYDIMKKHNGDVGVTSMVGKGTTFTLRIPDGTHIDA
jgi:PAS domain S-box-containing protein